jgi:hypothetical protein
LLRFRFLIPQNQREQNGVESVGTREFLNSRLKNDERSGSIGDLRSDYLVLPYCSSRLLYCPFHPYIKFLSPNKATNNAKADYASPIPDGMVPWSPTTTRRRRFRVNGQQTKTRS